MRSTGYRTRSVGAAPNAARCALAVALSIALLSAAALAEHGTFLPDEGDTTFPNPFMWGDRGTGANPITFQRDITDTTKNIDAGEIRFDYDAFGDFPATNPTAGAALSGGFFLNNGVRVKSGFSLHWAQTVNATRTGANIWNLPEMNAGTFPDTQDPDSPVYPFEQLNSDVNPPAADTPDLPFVDFPTRAPNNGEQSWMGELGLVAISDTANLTMNGMLFHEVRVLGTLKWGFEFDDEDPVPDTDTDVDTLTEVLLRNLQFGNATQDYLDTLNEFFDGMGGGDPNDATQNPVATTKYKFSSNANIFIPEPTALAMLLIGGLAMRRRR